MMSVNVASDRFIRPVKFEYIEENILGFFAEIPLIHQATWIICVK